MSPNENLHYAIGQLAYAIANSDGKVQNEEREKFHKIVEAELRCRGFEFNVSDIIFKIMDKEKTSTQDAYMWSMNQIRLNSHYLSPELKETFVKVIEKIAKAYPPVTAEENAIIQKFKTEIADIHGDPVYYEKRK
ncbi:MAG: TerB family tellurite resistance protein [Bacteroidetes bacterium]|nr:TerB family tellurite resistance protein [Bacteroidota bacterium]